MQPFVFNQQAAIKANSGNSRITPHEHHVVKITQAYWGVSEKGAKFLSLNLINENKETADEIKIYYESGQGEQLSGYNQINAIIGLNNITQLSYQQGSYKAYDYDAGGVVDKQGLIAPELVGKAIGVVLSENYYLGQNGIKHNLNLSAIYHWKTGQTAKQYFEQKPADSEQIIKACQYAEKSSQKSREKAEQEAGQQGNGNAWQSQPPRQYENLRPSPSTAMQREPQHHQAPQGNFAPQPTNQPQNDWQQYAPNPPQNGQGVPNDDMPF